ncbi:hypothetical protein GCK72_020041 [Caenorhabditis remanei]|uniref:SXP/RAL-2 family protein Ani s 5-like cation-binding domain-containing protein n=1 Tax=Caenorhabditis remanei TaxID=31234 RepID=A0A6A5GFF9_CAERE|nr:hypothetical protein GCK72_020041 [Caenorhabditis remanei]KAF1753484.1 hypothetical protein GCK72_020041 [Caenorhabditis remanei]
MCSSKVIFAIVASIALASAVPNTIGLEDILGGNGGVLGGITSGEGGLGGVLGGLLGGENGGLTEIVNNLLGGNEDALGGLLSILGGTPGGLGLPIIGNLTELPQFLVDFLQGLPEPVLAQVTDILSNASLSIDEITQQLQQALSGQNENLLASLLATVTNLVSELLSRVSEVVANLGSVFDQLTQILNNQDQTLLQQNEAIENLRKQSPIELEAIFLIASRVAKTLQGGNGGVVPELPVPLPETPQVPV